jgi:uncharacterized membrane protein YjjP (DUF1212 family)
MFLIGIMLFFTFFIAGIVMVVQGDWIPAISFFVASLLIVAVLAYFSMKQKRRKETAKELGELALCASDAVCCLLDFFDLCV